MKRGFLVFTMWNSGGFGGNSFSFINKISIKPRMKQYISVPCLLVSLLLAGCGQANTANGHLGSIDQTAKEMKEELKKTREFLDTATTQSQRIADALVSLQTLAQDMVKIIQTTFVKKPPAATDDIDSVLGGGADEGEKK
jgi:predicted small secreted protein